MDTHLKLARAITELLDNKFGVGKLRVGLDPIIGAVPVVGDFITLGLSAYLIWIGVQMRIPQEKIMQMVSNVVIDFVLGLFPVVGDIGDFIFKANSKNLKILEEYSAKVVEGEVLHSTN